MEVKSFSTEWGGKTLSIEVGKFANQANGAAVCRYGDTTVLATAVMSDHPRESISFFPLMVDMEEKLYAAGKIKSSRFMKREGRPSDDAVLTGRMIDRAIRPLFDYRIRNDVQVILTVLSVDQENDSDIPSFVAASTALAISNIPWNGPITAVRIGRIASEDPARDAEWVINPTFTARAKSMLDLVVAGTPERVIMLEAGGNEIPEAVVAEAISFAQKHLREPLDLVRQVVTAVGREKLVMPLPLNEEELGLQEKTKTVATEARTALMPKIQEALFSSPKRNKVERHAAREAVEEDLEKYLISKSTPKEIRAKVLDALDEWFEEETTRAILEEGKRVDGRSLSDIRPLKSEVALLPRVHGSGLFQRGDTQVLTTVTLGAPGDEQTLEGIEFSGTKRFFHHYNFLPFSVGETGPLRGAGRREIGHGALAEKAILPLVPQDKEKFPYTIRVVSEVLGSNGSSSMASSCCSSLALMDAGVPIAKHVAGIAMGLASEDPDQPEKKYKILTDLQDLEDGTGGMDFKIAGTRDGITAIQLDTKTVGLTFQIVHEALTQAREARLKILDVMEAAIPTPRPDLSPYAPRITSFMINPERIRDVIGPGGKMINEIIATLGVTIDVEDSGLVMITSVNQENAQKATDWIKRLTRETKVGEVYEGKVTRLMEFGAFVEIGPRQEGMVHISELAPERVNRVEDVVKIGDVVKVKVIEIDSMGRINLSIKQAADPSAPPIPTQRRSGPPRNSGGPHRGGLGGFGPPGRGRPPRRDF